MIHNKQLIEGLNDLLEKAYDAEKGFNNAYENTDNPRLKTFFKSKAEQRKRFGHEIKSHIRLQGGDPEKGGSMKGKAHRMWMDIVATFTGKEEEEILDVCEDGEEKAIEEYKDFLKMSEIPVNIRHAMTEQLNEIERTKRIVDELEEAYS